MQDIFLNLILNYNWLFQFERLAYEPRQSIVSTITKLSWFNPSW